MLRVDEAVQEADRQRLDALFPHRGDLGAHRILVERQQHLAAMVQPLRHRQAQAARHQWLRQGDVQVVLVVAALVAEGEHVAEALGGQQGGPGALALDHRIGGERRAMHQQRHIRRGEPGLLQHQRHAFQQPLLRRGGGGQDLGRPALRAGFRDPLHREVREGAADIGSETDIGAHRPGSIGERGCGAKRRCGIDITPRFRPRPGQGKRRTQSAPAHGSAAVQQGTCRGSADPASPILPPGGGREKPRATATGPPARDPAPGLASIRAARRPWNATPDGPPLLRGPAPPGTFRRSRPP